MSDDPWWESFEADGLNQAVLEALTHNYDLGAAAARVDAAAGQARIAGADLYPQVGVGADAARAKVVIPTIQTPSGPLQATANSYGVSLDVSWEIDVWGRLRAYRDAGRLDLAATTADYIAAQHSLAAQTAKTWFAWQEARLQLDLARRTVASFERTNDVVVRRFTSGRGAAFDVRLSESEVAAARALRALREEQLGRVVRQLEILLGRYPAGALDAAEGLPELASSPAAGLPSELLRRRPDLQAAELRLLATDERLYAARAELWPRLSLTVSGGRTSAEFGDLLDDQFDVWSIAGNLFQPLFQGGRLKGNVQVAEAQVREVLQFYASDVLAAFSEVEIVFAIEQYLNDQVQQNRASASAAVEAYSLAEGRYAAGREEISALLLAQRRAIEAEVSLLDVRRRRLETRVDLYLALGGGFDLEQASVTADAQTDADDKDGPPTPDSEGGRG